MYVDLQTYTLRTDVPRLCMMQPMGDESNTAQVHPQKLSQALMEAAQQKGAQLRIGEVQNILTSGKRVTGKHGVAAPPPVVDT